MQANRLAVQIRFLDKRWYVALTPVFLLVCLLLWLTVTTRRTIADLVKQVQVVQTQLGARRIMLHKRWYLRQELGNTKSLSLPHKADVWRKLYRLPLQHWQQTVSGLEIAFLLSWSEIKRVIPLLPDLLEADQTMRYRIVKQSPALLLTVWIDDDENY